MKNWKTYLLCAGILFAGVSCSDEEDDQPIVVEEPTALNVKSFVTGLKAPIGGDIDAAGNLWVTSAGTGNNDAAVLRITPAGKQTVLVDKLPSAVMNGSIEGISHALVSNNKVYFLHGISGYLYIVDIANFGENSSVVDSTKIIKQNVAEYVNSQNLVNPLNSNAYDLTIGPGGDLFFTDAGSNAIIRRAQNGTLSVFAKFANLANGSEAVPTGLKWTGKEFLVTTLSGFPFAPEAAILYKVTDAGVVSAYKQGYSLLSNVNTTASGKALVTQLGVFGQGFGATDGKVLDEEGKVLASGFGMPTDLIKKDDRSYYIVNYLSGTIDLLSY